MKYKFKFCAVLFSILFQSSQTLALNFPIVGTAAPGALQSGGMFKVLQLYMGQGAMLLGLVLAIAGFIWVSYAALSKFNEVRQGRAEWAELTVLVVVGTVILIFNSILLNQMGSVSKELEEIQVANNSERVDNNTYNLQPVY